MTSLKLAASHKPGPRNTRTLFPAITHPLAVLHVPGTDSCCRPASWFRIHTSEDAAGHPLLLPCPAVCRGYGFGAVGARRACPPGSQPSRLQLCPSTRPSVVHVPQADACIQPCLRASPCPAPAQPPPIQPGRPAAARHAVAARLPLPPSGILATNHAASHAHPSVAAPAG